MAKKAITFSYDDGITQDLRLIDIFNKYNLKATFNLNSELLGKGGTVLCGEQNLSHVKVAPQDVKHIYQGHEVAVHTLTHPLLPSLEESEIIRQVEQDRLNLSNLVGYEVVGMAYPCGGENNDDRTAKIIKEHTGVKYARALACTLDFKRQENLFRFKGTCQHHGQWKEMFELGEKFLQLETEEPAVFYIWGHSYEFDAIPERWAMFEEFCKMMSGRNDCFYGTNKEVLLMDWWQK